MKRCLILDSYYPDFIRTCPVDQNSTYDVELRRILDRQFGTADFYSKHLSNYGFECADIIVNHSSLQEMWAREHMCHADIVQAQIDNFSPDCIVFQDLSLLTADQLHELGNRYLLAAQCSCRLPEIERVKAFDVIFSSFQFYVPKFAEIGVKCVYIPLAFEPSVLTGDQPARDIDISFVGGLGRDLYWKQGTDTMEAVAAAFPDNFHWFGYGVEHLAESSPLRKVYRGTKWGREMYDVYRRSRIVVNRHGEITQGFMNNLRAYEATGCGALLLTEDAPNLRDFFEPNECASYKSPEDAVSAIQIYLEERATAEYFAANGQDRTLRDHTYEKRMKAVSETLMGML